MGGGTELDQLVADVHQRIGGDDLDRLAEAQRVSQGLQAAAKHLVDGFVREARDAGRTWAEIGAVLGISKQAAQQLTFRRALHTVRASMGRQAKSGVPFGRAARRVTRRADEEAARLGHDYVGSEHLFLGLLADADGRSLLEQAGVPVERVQEQLNLLAATWSGPGDGVRSPTPRLERVLDRASQWARVTEVAEVGVGELMLAVLDAREASGVIETVLVKEGGTSSMLLSSTLMDEVLRQ